MTIDISKVYELGKQADNIVMTTFKAKVNSEEFQQKVLELLCDAANQGKTTGYLIIEYATMGKMPINGNVLVEMYGKKLIDIETNTSFVRTACNDNFMKFAEVIKELFDESKMNYTIDEISNFGPGKSRNDNSPQIKFIIQLREIEE